MQKSCFGHQSNLDNLTPMILPCLKLFGFLFSNRHQPWLYQERFHASLSDMTCQIQELKLQNYPTITEPDLTGLSYLESRRILLGQLEVLKQAKYRAVEAQHQMIEILKKGIEDFLQTKT